MDVPNQKPAFRVEYRSKVHDVWTPSTLFPNTYATEDNAWTEIKKSILNLELSKSMAGCWRVVPEGCKTEKLDHIDPAHYKDLDPEPVNVAESWDLNPRLFNALKYIARAGRKPGADAVTDLRKAVRYLNRDIARREGRTGVWE